MLEVSSFIFVLFLKLTNQIQFEVTSDNNVTNRQQFYPNVVQLQFQYRPDLGGPWQNSQASWGRPVFSTNNPIMFNGPVVSSKPLVGVGSATPVLQFPGPVNNNAYNNNVNNVSSSSEEPMNLQSQNMYVQCMHFS